jgi:hypothetical protein
MEGLVWFAAAGVLFVLVHVAVAAYLYRSAASRNHDPAGEYVPSRDGDERTIGTGPASGSPDRVPCPSCGVPNDPSYRFCRRCVADLQRRVTATTGTNGRKRLGS